MDRRESASEKFAKIAHFLILDNICICMKRWQYLAYQGDVMAKILIEFSGAYESEQAFAMSIASIVRLGRAAGLSIQSQDTLAGVSAGMKLCMRCGEREHPTQYLHCYQCQQSMPKSGDADKVVCRDCGHHKHDAKYLRCRDCDAAKKSERQY